MPTKDSSKDDSRTAEKPATAENAAPLEASLRAKVEAASRISRGAGEFQNQAFPMILQHLLETEDEAPAKASASNGTRRRNAKRRPTKASTPSLERIKAILDADGGAVSDIVRRLSPLTAKHKIYGILGWAQQNFNVNGLTMPELREVANTKLRFGIADGTLQGRLSEAPSTDINRIQNEAGEFVYQLMRGGEDELRKAESKATKDQAASPVGVN